jgi:lysophospholipase L1-like esterase
MSNRIQLVAWGVVLAVSISPGAKAETIRIVTLGDSITKGVRPGVKAHETFSALLEKSLRQQGISVEVVNTGAGGESTPGALRRLAKDVLARSPHLVTVMYGTNDSYVDRNQKQARVAVDDYRRLLLDIVDQLRTAGIQVVLMTEPAYAENGPKNGLGEDCNDRLAEYMKVCRTVAAAKKLPLVDHFAHWSALREKGVKLQPWTTDGYHPSPTGHEDLAHRITQVTLPLVQRIADRVKAWDSTSPYRLSLDTLSHGYDGKMCWVHPRAGALPTEPPTVVLTMQKLLLSGSDVFYALNELRSDNGGKTWADLREHEKTLGRRDEGNGVIVAACDFTPKWHSKSGKLLGIGQTVRYLNNKVIENRPRETCYAVYDAKEKTWSPWTVLDMPREAKFFNAGAGSVQRVDLPEGDILLPIYFRGKEEKHYRVTVVRCSFDGTTVRYREHGDELELASGRGLFEPSLTRFGKKYYLTMRNDSAAYVSVSEDGLHFGKPRRWEWDDGSELGNYNTQQHWVTHGDALYLVYTRKGAHNDHVFRHRAPLFIAQVDAEKLCVVRDTERIAVPERGARLGNFGIVDVSENETWITVAEWMQTWGPNHVIRPDNIYESDNSVYAARVRWSKPNRVWNQR